MFSPDGRVLASASSDQTIRLWDTTTWKRSAILRGHGNEVHGLAFSPDGRLLASGCKDGTVLLWSARNPKPSGGRQSLPARVFWTRFLADGQTVLAQSTNGVLSVIDLSTLHETRLTFPSSGRVARERLAYSAPNFVGAYDGVNHFRLFEILSSGAKLMGELDIGASFKGEFAYSPNLRVLAWRTDGSRNLQIAGLDGTPKRTSVGSDTGRITPVRFSANGRRLMGFDREQAVHIWEVTSGERVVAAEDYLAQFGPLITTHSSGSIDPLDRLQRGNAILNWMGESAASIRSVAKPKSPRIWSQPPKQFTDLAFSPDGRTFAVSYYSGVVELYDAAEQKRLAALHGHLKSAQSVAFTPDGRRLASTCGDNEAVKLWDVKTSQELLTLPGQGALLTSVEFSDDGNTLLVGSLWQPGLCQFWRVPSWKEIEEVERKGGGWQKIEEK